MSRENCLFFRVHADCSSFFFFYNSELRPMIIDARTCKSRELPLPELESPVSVSAWLSSLSDMKIIL